MILHSHSAPHVNLRWHKLRYNWSHIALFSSASADSLLKYILIDDFQRWQLLTNFALTLTCNYSIVNTSSVNWASTHIWMPKPWQRTLYQTLLKQIQSYSHLNSDDENGQYQNPQCCWPSWKNSLSNFTNKQWERNIRIYCILNTEINIILLHWNKQHFESGIIQWGCRFLDENFHLLLMITCFAMEICDRVGTLSHMVYTLGARLTSTCLRSRHLHEVERYTRTMVFWTFFPLVPPHFDDWHRHLDSCHKSESSDHRI